MNLDKRMNKRYFEASYKLQKMLFTAIFLSSHILDLSLFPALNSQWDQLSSLNFPAFDFKIWGVRGLEKDSNRREG